ncbi:MAG: hypothetical protein ABFR95_04615 [Actinomycetota bacterium]
MCCLFAALVLIGPRFAILMWWLFDQARWTNAFEGFFVAFLGWAFVPWTTMMYVVVYTNGINGFDWIILGMGILADLGSWTSGGWSGRRYQTDHYAA